MLKLILPLLFIIQPQNLFTRLKAESGIPLGWAKMPIVFFIQKGGSDQIKDGSDIKVIFKSLKTWEKVPCAELSFQFAGYLNNPTYGYRPGEKNKNVILWIKSIARWPYPYDVLASTAIFWNQTTGEILDADILINDFGFDWSTSDKPEKGKYDLQNTATHEIGHLLGLDHSDDPESTMYWDSPPEETKKRDLNKDDIEGICQIYPKNPPKITFEIIEVDSGINQNCDDEKNSPPSQRSKNNCSLGGEALPLYLLLPLLLLAPKKERSSIN